MAKVTVKSADVEVTVTLSGKEAKALFGAVDFVYSQLDPAEFPETEELLGGIVNTLAEVADVGDVGFDFSESVLADDDGRRFGFNLVETE